MAERPDRAGRRRPLHRRAGRPADLRAKGRRPDRLIDHGRTQASKNSVTRIGCRDAACVTLGAARLPPEAQVDPSCSPPSTSSCRSRTSRPPRPSAPRWRPSNAAARPWQSGPQPGDRGTQAQRVSSRQVQPMFQAEGQTLSGFVLDRRLNRAMQRLIEAEDARPVSAITFDVAFGDLSYVNRTFRKRFALTPSQVRRLGRTTGGVASGPAGARESLRAER
ncbi:helix-turn-helix domain-containing protein [Methylobacterium sp. J-092]|uniref:helix-turn-helix domain-containing protein n=1 Tax=Methylobacterium sp. J-092 TaxID=2836667 RepID=UPI0028C4775D|nr:helix-turn-helix domain-containing protein [Methylobacterium sp. J-092]